MSEGPPRTSTCFGDPRRDTWAGSSLPEPPARVPGWKASRSSSALSQSLGSSQSQGTKVTDDCVAFLSR